MSNKTFIIEKNPGEGVPETYIRSVIAAGNSCAGYSIQMLDDKKQPMLVSDRMDVAASMDGVKDLLERAKAHRLLLTFSKVDKVSEKVLQPFDYSMPGDITPLISVAVDGEFPSMKEEGLTEEANFSHKFILPALAKLVKLSDGNLDNFLKEIRDPVFVDSLMARIGERAAFCFFPPVGEGVWLGKNKLGSVFPWGTVSNTLGYQEAAPSKPSEAVKPPPGKFWFNWDSGPALPVEKAEEVKHEPQKEAAPSLPLNLPADKPDTKIDAPPADPNAQPSAGSSEPPKMVQKKVPDGMNLKDRKKFIRRVTNCGNNLPDGWDKPGFTYWAVDYPEPSHVAAQLQQKFSKDQPKDMRGDAPRPVATRGSETEAAEAQLMVLSKEEASAAETAILKIMDRQGKNIPSPLDIQKAVSKYPAFSKKFAVGYDQMLSWHPTDVAEFLKSSPKAGFHWLLEVQAQWAAARQELADLKAKEKPVASGQPPIIPEVKAEEPKKTGTGGWASW